MHGLAAALTVLTPGIAIAFRPGMHAVVADDDRVATTIIAKVLQRSGAEVTVVHDGNAAWRALTDRKPANLAVVDWMMPGLNGVELCRRVRSDASLASLYVVLLTGRATRTDLIAGLDAGADDYMVKPVDAEELRARLQVGMRVVTLQRRLTERVSELQAARDHLARLASTDALTNVFSRGWWFELATNEYLRSRRSDRNVSLLAIDIDFFKKVNDTYGHYAGDRVLQDFADLLRRESRASDLVGRFGGEEFVLLLPDTSMSQAQALAQRITDGCRALIVPWHGRSVRFTCSIGVSEVEAGDDSLEAVLRRADGALYDAKRNGRDCWRSDAPSPEADQTSNPSSPSGDRTGLATARRSGDIVIAAA